MYVCIYVCVQIWFEDPGGSENAGHPSHARQIQVELPIFKENISLNIDIFVMLVKYMYGHTHISTHT